MELNKYHIIRGGSQELQFLVMDLDTREEAQSKMAEMQGLNIILSGLEILALVREENLSFYEKENLLNDEILQQGEGISTKREDMVKEWEKLCQDTMTPNGIVGEEELDGSI